MGVDGLLRFLPCRQDFMRLGNHGQTCRQSSTGLSRRIPAIYAKYYSVLGHFREKPIAQHVPWIFVLRLAHLSYLSSRLAVLGEYPQRGEISNTYLGI